MEIKKVLKDWNGAKYIIVPKKSDIEIGDLVAIKKINQGEEIKINI